MNLLALDTSTSRSTVALAVGSDRRAAPSDPAATARHGRELIPAIAELCRAAGIAPARLDAIGVGLGPGSYTGLRIGLTAAKTLAFALGKPLVAVDTFAALARNAPPAAAAIHVIGDAQRGDLYAARFERVAGAADPRSVAPLHLVAMTEWVAALEPGAWVIGPNLDRLRVAWPEGVHLGSPDQGQPSADALIALATIEVAAGRFADPHALEPTYLRRSAAEDQWDHRPAARSRP